MTPKGQMSSSGSGPAIMMMQPHIRVTFMPDPPIKHLAPPKRRRPKAYPDDTIQTEQHPKTTTVVNPPPPTTNRPKSNGITGVAAYLPQFEPTPKPPPKKSDPTPATIKLNRSKERTIQHG
eukprot:CAMPEP_0198262088 /NCGR_PEP_ID=MMETSP1447-20131203/10657_1 /TAXON_ID=420782 /ORGANISM="Chaetoceros dichaeta, Strain CCMP1751" /LENGTH=120 /DNA_ID=CAMNT_0043950201 /DNA_START=142 /DNA_END=501 /DNA_ORIENTATION=+